MTARREVHPDTGEEIIVSYDKDGNPVTWWSDPGWLGAENSLAGRKIEGFGGTIAGMFTGDEADQARAAQWAQQEPYFDALRTAHPSAAVVGETVPSIGISMLNPFTRAASMGGQIATNVGEALFEEYLNYDPNKQLGDYGDAAVNATAGDLIFRGLGRVLWGAENLLKAVNDRGLGNVFARELPEAAQRLTDRGYELVNPASYLEQGHPLRGTIEQMVKGNESSALPSRELAARAQRNMSRLRGRARAALGLDPTEGDFTNADLLAAGQRLDGVYEDLKQDLPETLQIPHETAQAIADTPGYRKSANIEGKAYSDIRRYFTEVEQFQASGAGAMPEPPTINRDELFSLRSTLTKDAAETADANVVRDIGARIDALDSAVAQQAGSEEWLARYATAREQWETLFAMQRPGVVGKEGNINLLSLARSMSAESNFGRTALYGDDTQFTNQATADLAGDVAALVQPETYANSQTTDRQSFLQFAASAATQPWYAGATLANEYAVNQMARGDNLGRIGGMTAAQTQADIPPAGEQIIPTLLYSPDPGRRNQAATLGSQLFSRPEDSGNFVTDSLFPYLEQGILPNEQVRDAALGVFTGTEDKSQP